LEAGRCEFSERGDSRAVIREIARRAGVVCGLVVWNELSVEGTTGQRFDDQSRRACTSVQSCVARSEHTGGSTL
jgi:hypothetical protein